MATTIKTSDGDVLDRLCHQHYGHLMGTVEAVLEANPGLAALRDVDGPVLFAHADLSGYSVFEEASWWGVAAAGRIMGQKPSQS